VCADRRRCHRPAAGAQRSADRIAEREAGLRDQLRGSGHLQSRAGDRRLGEHRRRAKRGRALQEDRGDAGAHLDLLRGRHPARAGVRGRAAGRQLSQGARRERARAGRFLRRHRAEGRRGHRGPPQGPGRRSSPGGPIPVCGGQAPRGRGPRSHRRKSAAPRRRPRAEAVALRAAGAGGNGSRAGVGLAQHLYLYESDGRTGHCPERLQLRAGEARDRRERLEISLPGMERRLHHFRPARLHGSQGTARLPGGAQAGARSHSRGSRLGGHAAGRGRGVREQAAGARVPGGQRRRESLLHPPRRRAGRALQAALLQPQGQGR
jgi:hypothetical protein